MKRQIIELDFIRALAITLIVLCHMHFFIKSSFLEMWSSFPAYLGLSLFFLLSGFLMNHNRKIKSKNEIIPFIKKRIRRIYPLYLLAFILSIMLDLSNIGQFVGTIKKTDLIILNIFGLQGLLPIEYTTYGFWFIGAILLYYTMYIFISYYSSDIKKIFINSFVLIIPLLILRSEFGLIRTEIFDYYPSFIAGILSAEFLSAEVKDFKQSLIIAIYSFIIMILYYLLNYFEFISIRRLLFLDVSLTFNLVIIFLIVCYVTYVHNKINVDIFPKSITGLTSTVAYCSYCIYLFHISVLSILMSILNKMGIYNGTIYIFSIVVIGTPLVFIVGYYFQEMSDHRF